VEILRQVPEAVHRKRPEIWPNNWIFHHNNAPPHKALSVKQFLAQKIDFLKIKFALKGQMFQDFDSSVGIATRL
jgi:hypothetical protein